MWAVFKNKLEQIHVVPVGDQRSHMVSRDCWCNPAKDEDSIWRHNSYDRREEAEGKTKH